MEWQRSAETLHAGRGYIGGRGVSQGMVWCLQNTHHVFKTFSGTMS